MKLAKKMIGVLLIAAVIFLLPACSGKEEDYSADLHSLGRELLEKAAFEDELNAADETVIRKLYAVGDYKDAQVYISSGATAEEIALFEFQTKEAAEKGLEIAGERISDQKADFESYIPKEVKKLEDAIVRRYGQYVVVCVSDSDEAEKIIRRYFND